MEKVDLEALDAMHAAAGLSELFSSHIVNDGYTHLANLTMAPDKPCFCIMHRKEVVDWFAANHNAYPAIAEELRALRERVASLYTGMRRVIVAAGGVAEDGVSDEFLLNAAGEVRALRAEVEKLKDDLCDAEELASDAQERCVAEWEKDCANALRCLAEETNFQWDPDGDPADTIREHIQLTLEEYDGAVDRLRAEVARLREALDPIARAYQVSMKPFAPGIDEADGAQHWMPHGWPSVADFKAAAAALSSTTTTAEWLAARDAEQRRIGAAEWLEKEAAENLERFGTHFYESTTDSMLAEAARLRRGE